MRAFAALFERLDRTTSTDGKVAALKAYFESADPADAAWGLHFLAGGKLKRLLPSRRVREWLRSRIDIEPWLFEEAYASVGDLAETVTLLIDAVIGTNEPPASVGLRDWVEGRLLTLRGLDSAEQDARLTEWTGGLPREQLFLILKMVTGAMRIGVSRTTVERAIAEMAGVEQSVIAHRLMGDREPTAGFFERLISTDDADVDAGRPYPFFLASPIVPPELPAGFDGTETDFVARELGDAADWLAEWKWDGIRAQLIKRAGGVFLWSRGDDNLTERLPELTEAAARLPDGSVLDGEVICWHGNGPEEDHPGGPMEFGVLQRRIGRTQIGPKILSAAPVAFLAYDALESDGADLRLSPLEERRNALASILTHAPARLHASPIIPFESWAQLAAERETSRARGVEGVMLKRRGSPYRSGRRRGDWWKWKIEPLTIDAVLVYAQPGHGRRAGVMTDYTFAVWDGSEPGEGRLVTVTKAYTGLTDEEFAEMDRWIRRHTKERFGPVRQVEPAHVFEIAFDSARLSGRHKSGVALRFPRMKRWRRDLGIDGADTLEAVLAIAGGES